MATTSAPTFRALPRRAQAYIPAVILAGSVAVLGASAAGSAEPLDPSLLAITVLLCAGANLLEVFAPGHYSFQPNLVFFFWGSLLLPPWAVAALSLVCFLPGWLKHRFRWYMVAFNVANYTLAGLAAHEIGRLGDAMSTTTAPSASGVLALVLASVGFVGLNLGLIVLVVSFARGRPIRDSARDMSDSLSLDLALAMTGACLAALWQQAEILAILATGPMLLVYRALWVPLLRHKSRTDPKTGLSNSEHLERVFGDALAVSRKHGTSLSLVMIDLDHLRIVNNTHGHLAGDRLLRATAEEVLKVTGPRDTAARFGGDEFCLLLPGKSLPAARSVAESVRGRIEALSLSTEDGGPPITSSVSAGIACFPEHGETANALLSAADAAVYDAKLGGRNRVRTALPPRTREALELLGTPAAAALGSPGPRELSAPDLPRPAAVAAPAPSVSNGSGAGASPDDSYPDGRDPSPTGSHVSHPDSPAAAPADEEQVEPARPVPASRRLIPWLTGVLLVAAATVGLLSSAAPIGRSPVLFGLLVAVFVALDQVRIDIFERANVSPAAIPALVLAYDFGPLGPLAAEGVLAVVRALRRETLIKWTFDLGALALAGAAAAFVFDIVPGEHRGLMLAVGAGAGLAYYVVNATLLGTVMGLAEGKSPVDAWRERLAWLWPHYICFGMLAALFVASERELGLYVIGVFTLPLLMVWLAQKQYLDRSRSSVAELRRSHEELELTNERLRVLLEDNNQLLAHMHRSYLSTITSLARTIEAKDPYTGGHTERVAEIGLALARELGFSQTDLQAVNVGALIHDIGKIGVPDAVLLKQGPLTDDEFAEIREHPRISSYIVADLELPPIVKQMVRSHHERFDGHGYPDGLVGEEIPLAARILSVADALDAMTSDRPYRSALSVQVARAEIEAKAGSQFCPQVVQALSACIEREPELWERLRDEQFSGGEGGSPAPGLASV
jgi:diguanylate cyclase (GGDEF)-like protein/putative nucleotidyltransferase with HDIG domain